MTEKLLIGMESIKTNNKQSETHQSASLLMNNSASLSHNDTYEGYSYSSDFINSQSQVNGGYMYLACEEYLGYSNKVLYFLFLGSWSKS